MLKSHPFEVVVDVAGKTEIDGIFESKELAISRAEFLLAQKKYNVIEVYKVKSPELRLRLFREVGAILNKNITIALIEETALCNEANQLFMYDSRLTLLRLLRSWLNLKIMLPLEMLHNYGALREIEASPTLFDQGLYRLAGLQSHSTGDLLEQRHRVLTGLARTVMGLARTSEDLQPYADLLAHRGLTALIEELEASHPPEWHARVITYAVARHFASFDARDWAVLVVAGCDLFADGQSEAAAEHVDEILAETVDSNDAVKALLGHVPELRLGLESILAVAEGTWHKGLPGRPALIRLAALTSSRPMSRVRAALIRRAIQALDGSSPLTKGDRVQEARAFHHLLRRLADPAGCKGGPTMAGALIRRARLAFAKDDDQLTFDHAVTVILEELGEPPARLGFILDLLQSEPGRKNADLLARRLDANIGCLRSLRDLGPTWADVAVRSRIRQGISQSGLERHRIDGMLDRLERMPESVSPDTMLLCLLVSHRGTNHLVVAGGPPLTIGRGEGCRLVLVSPGASRRHAEILCEGNTFVLVDSSTNGTVIKGADGSVNKICQGRATLPKCGTIVIALPQPAGSQFEPEVIEFGPAATSDVARHSK